MSGTESKFDIWWNSPSVKRGVGAAYSLGAAVVIIGAMFKILHLPGAGIMLGTGMTVEAILFSLGVLDKPHKEYHWENVFSFDEGTIMNITGGQQTPSTSVSTNKHQSTGLNYSESLNNEDVTKLSEGIKNLSATADQLGALSNAALATETFVKSITTATGAAEKFSSSQEALNEASSLLSTSYQGIADGMKTVEVNTKQYATKVEDINRSLSSINSIYEIQLKNIEAQSEVVNQQTERIRATNIEYGAVLNDVQRIKLSTLVAADESESFKANTVKLAKQVADLNLVYGNMLNSLN